MISSTSNQKVKQAAALAKKAKYRTETGLFVVEGPKMAAELPDDRIQQVYVTEHFLEEEKKKADHALYQKLKQLKCVETVTDEVLKAMSDTQTPQGILALAKQYHYGLKDLLSQSGAAHFIVLERLQDPGNLGTILRAGEAAGITGVIMDSQTADIYNPKVIRSTMGSIYRMPFLYVEDVVSLEKKLKENGIRSFAAHLKGENSYDQESYTGGTAFFIGNEGKGLTDQAAEAADCLIRIPMCGKVESLNAAMASGILMYEAARQRRE